MHAGDDLPFHDTPAEDCKVGNFTVNQVFQSGVSGGWLDEARKTRIATYSLDVIILPGSDLPQVGLAKVPGNGLGESSSQLSAYKSVLAMEGRTRTSRERFTVLAPSHLAYVRRPVLPSGQRPACLAECR